MKRFGSAAALAALTALSLRAGDFPPKATATGSGLRVRDAAALDGRVAGHLGKGAAVYVLAEGPAAVIDGKEGRWLSVVSTAGVAGWAFGGYLQVEAPAAAEALLPRLDEAYRALAESPDEFRALDEELQQRVVARWIRDFQAANDWDADAVTALLNAGPAARMGVSVLLKALEVRGLPAWDSEDPPVTAIGHLLRVLSPDPKVLIDELIASFNRAGSRETLGVLTYLASSSPEKVAPFLEGLMRSDSWDIVRDAVDALPPLIGRPDFGRVLKAALKDEKATVRRGAAYAYTSYGSLDHEEASLLERALKDSDDQTRRFALQALSRWDSALPFNVDALRDPAPTVRRQAMSFFERNPSALEKAVPRLIPLLDDPDPYVRSKTEGLLRSARDPSAMPAVIDRARRAVDEAYDKGKTGWGWVRRVSPEKTMHASDDVVIVTGKDFDGTVSLVTPLGQEISVKAFATRKKDAAAGEAVWTFYFDRMTTHGHPIFAEAGMYRMNVCGAPRGCDEVPFLYLPSR